MTATFNFIEYVSNATDTATATNLNMGSTRAANLSPSTYKITAGNYSYEKWVKARFTGSFTNISDIKFWKSAGDYVTGESINFTGQVTSYSTPTESQSSHATSSVPTSEPGSANVGIGGSLSGSLTSTGSSDFIVLQSSITTSASSGVTNTKTFTLTYTEV